MKSVEAIVVLFGDAPDPESLPRGTPPVHTYDGVMEVGGEVLANGGFEECSPANHDLATLVYTSGTTG